MIDRIVSMAISTFADRSMWSPAFHAVTAKGKPCPPNDKRAVRWSVLGMMGRIAGRPDPHYLIVWVRQLLLVGGYRKLAEEALALLRADKCDRMGYDFERELLMKIHATLLIVLERISH